LYREPFVDFEDNFEGIDNFEEIDDLSLKYMCFQMQIFKDYHKQLKIGICG
jgi:hypothetical protein